MTDRIFTKQDIQNQLSDMKAPRDSVVLMHSSLRLVGPVEGGPRGLLDALIDYFTSQGGLFCVPTHTWDNLRKDITLDMSDPHTCLGALPDLAAADPRGVRSQNPTHSMVVFGPRERALAFITDDATVCSGTAPESCYGKLYSMGGRVLLVGVAHNKNTYLHCVDEILKTPDRMCEETRDMAVRLTSGEVVRRRFRMYQSSFTRDISSRFPKYETAFRYHGAITDGFVGRAPTQLCDARIMMQTVSTILSRANGADPLSDEVAILPALYC